MAIDKSIYCDDVCRFRAEKRAQAPLPVARDGKAAPRGALQRKNLDLRADKAEAIQYGGMGMARRMLTILGDVDRAMSGIEEDDQSPVAQGLRLLRNKMWHELQADGVTLIEAKGAEFDPSKMEAIATIPPSDAHPNGTVVDVLEQGYMYKSKVILAARVVVASE